MPRLIITVICVINSLAPPTEISKGARLHLHATSFIKPCHFKDDQLLKSYIIKLAMPTANMIDRDI